MLTNKVMEQSKVIDKLQNDSKEKEELFGILRHSLGLDTESKVKFDQFNPDCISVTDNGSLIKRIKNDEYTHCAYASSGFANGIRCFKLQLGESWYAGNYIGVVTKTYNGMKCKDKAISTDNGIGMKGFESNDVILLILNFHHCMIYFVVNGTLKQRKTIINGKTYYPCVNIRGYGQCVGNSCRVIKPLS